MTPQHIQNILDKLHGVKRAGNNQWIARCPAHDDQHPSLSIGIGDDGRALLKCHAGCHAIAIRNALRLSWSDYWPIGDRRREQALSSRHHRIIATYDYRDSSGNLLYQVVRYDPKDFRQRRPDGQGGWIWSLEGVGRVLYRLPELADASRVGEWIYVVEGEKDADRLAAAGLLATCNPGGAGKWNILSDNSILHGRRVCIIADADTPGRNHAIDVATRLFERAAEIRVIELPGAKDASDWFGAGGTVARLIELRDAAAPFKPSGNTSREKIIQTNTQLRDLADACIAALRNNNNPPVVFVRCGKLTRVVADENGIPHIEAYDRASLRGRLSEIADFFVLRRSGDDWIEVVAYPQNQLIETVLTIGEWDLPALAGVTRAPILRTDGTICTSPGYDTDTRWYYYPAPGAQLGEIPHTPLMDDVRNAIAKIIEIIADFPFADQASRANALALLFTMLMRPAIHGRVPLAVIDAPVQGTGKSLLAAALAIIAYGEICAESVPANGANSEEEWRKKITSILLRGAPFVLLDNVPDGSAIDSPALAAVLTADHWSDRLLGASENIVLRACTIWAATGNNLRIEGDMPRRCYLIRLDADVEQPWTREEFRIPDLEHYVRHNRAELLAAALTCIRGWYVAGQPQAEVPRLGGYEHWAQIVGSVLEYAGIDGFLGNLDQITCIRDDETQQWSRFFSAWWYEFRDQWVSTESIVARILESEDKMHDGSIPYAILAQRDRGPGSVRRSLGRSLSQLAGRIYDGRKLVSCLDRRRKAKLWRLANPGEAADSLLFSEHEDAET